jgi:hypothetical protein
MMKEQFVVSATNVVGLAIINNFFFKICNVDILYLEGISSIIYYLLGLFDHGCTRSLSLGLVLHRRRRRIDYGGILGNVAYIFEKIGNTH